MTALSTGMRGWQPPRRPPGLLARAGFHAVTALALAVFTPLSTGPVRHEDGLIVLRGLPRWAFRRGGTTVGRVYLTRDNDGDAVLRHERVHVEQWRRWGLLLPVLYALAGPNPLSNRWEIEAGLEDGGYVRRRRGRRRDA